MKTLVKMDEKGRVQIPTEMRKRLRLEPKQLISIEVKSESATLKKAERLDRSKDKVLRDILVNPGQSRIRITTELLNSMKEEVWTP
jgi:bifunctional DNA-binding transcriptional regulator/antitoxin component of YhaV-PrlF toxin-antitoxin module